MGPACNFEKSKYGHRSHEMVICTIESLSVLPNGTAITRNHALKFAHTAQSQLRICDAVCCAQMTFIVLAYASSLQLQLLIPQAYQLDVSQRH